MRWLDDVSTGTWLRDRITGGSGLTAVAGVGWAAYARILHPAQVFNEINGRLVETRWTWTETARRRGVAMHATAEWDAIGVAGGQMMIDGFNVSPGEEGRLDPLLMHELLVILRGKTSVTTDITVAVWEGFGTSAFAGSPYDVSNLRLPNGSYILGKTNLDDLDQQIDQDSDLGRGVQLVWPSTHEWLVASEIDYDSTIVGGPQALIDEIIQCGALESYEVG